MKKNLATVVGLCLLLVPALAFGQVKLQKARFAQKGKFHLGGGLNYSSTSSKMTKPTETDATDSSSFGFMPAIGYFVIDGLEVGAIIDYTSSSEGDADSSRFALGPQVAYYYKASPVLYPYGRAAWVFNLSEDNGDDAEYGGNKLRVGAGVGVAFGHKVGGLLSLGLDYVRDARTMKPKGASDTMEFETTGFELNGGFSIYF